MTFSAGWPDTKLLVCALYYQPFSALHLWTIPVSIISGLTEIDAEIDPFLTFGKESKIPAGPAVP